MKSFVLALMFMSSAAFARSMDVTPVLATVEGLESGITQVALLNDGRLMVTLEDGKHKTLVVSERNLAKMKSLANGLSNAEVKKITREHICMTFAMPMPQLSDLRVSQTLKFGGAMRLVLTNQGCYLRAVVTPVDAYNISAAQLLREKMVTLAFEATK